LRVWVEVEGSMSEEMELAVEELEVVELGKQEVLVP